MELKFFAKPGQNGQIFVGLDSMIAFLRNCPDTKPEYAEFKTSLHAMAGLLEDELVKIKEHQKIISDALSPPARPTGWAR